MSVPRGVGVRRPAQPRPGRGSSHGRPPVCKVMDYGKYRYEQEQKAKEARKRQTTISIKEIKLRPEDR